MTDTPARGPALRGLALHGLAAALGVIPRVSRAQKPLPPRPGKPGRPASHRPATHAPPRRTTPSVPTPPLAGRMPPLALPRANPPRSGLPSTVPRHVVVR